MKRLKFAMVDIQIIVAMADNRVIGCDGQIPWHLSADLKHFKKVTLGHSVVMGKRTFLSIGRVLPQRQNILISSTFTNKVEGLLVVSSLEEAMKQCESSVLMVIGGARLYQEALPLASTLHLTRINKSFEGDTYFPVFNEQDFVLTASESHFDEELKFKYCFETWQRNV